MRKSLPFGIFFLRMASFESKAISSTTATTVKHLGTARSAPPPKPDEPNGVIARWKEYRLDGELAQNDWIQHLELSSAQNFINFGQSKHPPKILLLYGSLRPVSYSKKLCYEYARVLEYLGADCRVFDPRDLPMHDVATYESHPKVKELRELSEWSEGQVWVSPEQHGAITGVMKTQIDWIPLSVGSVRPTQGRTLAVAQVSGGSQSFNVVNTLRLLGRWMRMITIPNQSSVPKAWTEFEDNGRMKDSELRGRVVDVCEELFKFTILTRDHADFLVDRFSEREEMKKNQRLLTQQEKEMQKNDTNVKCVPSATEVSTVTDGATGQLVQAPDADKKKKAC